MPLIEIHISFASLSARAFPQSTFPIISLILPKSAFRKFHEQCTLSSLFCFTIILKEIASWSLFPILPISFTEFMIPSWSERMRSRILPLKCVASCTYCSINRFVVASKKSRPLDPLVPFSQSMSGKFKSPMRMFIPFIFSIHLHKSSSFSFFEFGDR